LFRGEEELLDEALSLAFNFCLGRAWLVPPSLQPFLVVVISVNLQPPFVKKVIAGGNSGVYFNLA
jgi:hypothetical protein